MSKQHPPAPTASVVGPCPTLIQISRTPRHWKFTQHHRTTRPPPNTMTNTTTVHARINKGNRMFKISPSSFYCLFILRLFFRFNILCLIFSLRAVIRLMSDFVDTYNTLVSLGKYRLSESHLHRQSIF